MCIASDGFKPVRVKACSSTSPWGGYQGGLMHKSTIDIDIVDPDRELMNPPIANVRGLGKIGKSIKCKVLSRVFSEDYKRIETTIFDPRGSHIKLWNQIFLVACLVSLFVDPLFFFLPIVNLKACVEIQSPMDKILTALRSFTDVFYLLQICVGFRTAYVAPSSRIFGRGELVVDERKIASRYCRKQLWIDIFCMLPLPQVILWLVIPYLNGSAANYSTNILRFLVIFQYIPRLWLIFPLSSQIVKTSGIIEAAWAGAAYNLLLFLLASHFTGACWYLLAIERQDACWRSVCSSEMQSCNNSYFACNSLKNRNANMREEWFKFSNITETCITDQRLYTFGIYENALTLINSPGFLNSYLYCLWWGLQNLSSLGQNLQTSTYVGEIAFAILVGILGLVLFALLIGNMQTYLQSITVKLEQWRIRMTDTEEWMKHRQLPQDLRRRIRRYLQCKWAATRGVEEDVLLKDLPTDLHRDIKRHLCLDLVRRVPMFDQMDDRMLDVICERLKTTLITQGTYLVREGDPVNEMQFIIRGHLESYTTNGGRTGFFNSTVIGPGDFCGEELLTWALEPRSSNNFPSSTRTVTALVEVEAFALKADDLKFVSMQFRRLHSKKLQHTFRFYSHQWRTWAACCIQATWHRYKRRKLKSYSLSDDGDASSSISAASAIVPAVYVSLFASNAKKGGARRHERGIRSSIAKPKKPYFIDDN